MTFSLCKSLSERGGPWQEKDRVERYGCCGREEDRDGQSERESAR